MASEKSTGSEKSMVTELLIGTVKAVVDATVNYFTSKPEPSEKNYEDLIERHVINPDKIDVDLDSIGGLKAIKQEMRNLVILPLQRPELYANGKLRGPQKGILFLGPPGTGKTMLAKALAKESGANFINVEISDLITEWLGDARKHVAALFSLAAKKQPAIIFIDEVDGFLGKRRDSDHEVMINMKTEFMSQWEGFKTDKNARVMVLAATNRPEELDKAILRRFHESFVFEIPNLAERADILEVILKKEMAGSIIDYYYLAGLCEGFTGSDLAGSCNKAARIPISELLEAEKKGMKNQVLRPLSQSDLQKVLSESKKTTTVVREYSKRPVSE